MKAHKIQSLRRIPTHPQSCVLRLSHQKKGQVYYASIQSRESQRLYDYAKYTFTKPTVIPAGKRIALSNALIAPRMEFYITGVSYNKEGLDAITTVIHELEQGMKR